MKNETPDSYITRHEMELEPGPPPEEDRCPVCTKFECICPLDDPEPTDQTKQSGQTSVRDSFVKTFGEDQAQKFEAAANEHGNGINDKNKGDDPFKWATLIVIGYQCAEVEGYRKHHGITTPWKKIQAWIKQNAELSTHNGDCDYLALIAGTYNQYVKPRSQRKRKASATPIKQKEAP